MPAHLHPGSTHTVMLVIYVFIYVVFLAELLFQWAEYSNKGMCDGYGTCQWRDNKCQARPTTTPSLLLLSASNQDPEEDACGAALDQGVVLEYSFVIARE